ncbi:hypothetical protein WBP06_22260 [Novosphingobium sp. BL-8H]|uniref:hypothetical protein n=1 Tax=Novosphingobium sp. BL-8H TaxID=3127640 RepID=UPI0037567F44
MIKTLSLAIPPLLVGAAVISHGPSIAPTTPASPTAPLTMTMVDLASIAAGATTFRMPSIAKPAVASSSCPARSTIRLTASTPPLKSICASGGKILVNGSNAQGFAMSDIVTRGYGPVMRGVNVPDLRVERVSATGARADPTLGLGLVNISSGIGHAVFRDVVWIGDTKAPAINGDDAWGAITLKGKNAKDFGTFEITGFDFQNLFMAPGSHYRNVDGISTEKGFSGTISNGRVMNASDACLDIKGDVKVTNVYLSGCREGLKIWQSQHHGLVELGSNSFAGIIGKGSPSETRTIEIEVLIASGNPDIPLFVAEEGKVILHIGRLVAKSNQVLKGSGSYSGSQVIVDQRITN